jgi:hypothetical protein
MLLALLRLYCFTSSELYANADLQRDKAVGADLWTVFQQPDQRRDATMQAVRKMVDQKQVRVLLDGTCSSHGRYTNCMGLSSCEAKVTVLSHSTLQWLSAANQIMQEFALELAFPDARATAGLQRVMARFRPAATETLAEGTPAIGIPGFVPWQNKMPNYFFATISLKVRAM